jgi:hypothetical protein
MTRPKFLGGLRFRDLELFNLALLARQAWRVLQEPMPLSARILKAAYLPNSSILEATLGSHPSQIWWAILDGREVLVQGLVSELETVNPLTYGLRTGCPVIPTLGRLCLSK